MGTVDAGTIKGEGSVRYRTTVHGPVTGYATAGGKRVAIARKRASFGRDVLWQLPFRDATIGRITGTRSFAKAFARSPFTFNVGYADDRDIAMFSAGELPRRDPRVDPRLPTLGTGGYEWRGILAARRLPQQVNPRRRRAAELEQQPAPGFGAADDNWSYGSLHRVSLLAEPDRPPAQARPRLGDERDERGGDAGPALDRADADALDAAARRAARRATRAERMLERLETWNANGSIAPRPRRGRRHGLGRRARDHGRVLPAPARRGAGRRARPAARRPQGARGRQQRPAPRLHRRRDQLHRQGPAPAARHAVQAPVQDPLLRRRRPRRVPHRGLERARRRRPGARDRAGQREPRRLEVGRRRPSGSRSRPGC